MWGWRQQTTMACVYLCNNTARSTHVPQNLKYNLKKRIHKFGNIKIRDVCQNTLEGKNNKKKPYSKY